MHPWKALPLLLHTMLLSFMQLLGPKAAAMNPSLRNESDRLALLAFRDGISDDPLQILKLWNSSLHFCEWKGITCSRRHPQRVVALELSGSGLVGHISPFIANLTFLRTCSLSNNNFYGEIPQEMGFLFRLRYLNLSSNSFSGKIPAHLVKVLNQHQQGALKSFIAECEVLRNIRHRNLVKILTACSSIDYHGNDFKALVFEFIPNGNLEMWLHPSINDQHHINEQHQLRGLSLIERLNIAIDVAYAVEYLHHYGQTPLIHHDLKPSNVLLDNEMTAHVSDFGLAKFVIETTSTSQSQTSSTSIKGTVGYLAPEYGLGGKSSIQGDVYSYGILLLEMFTGKRPTDDMFKNGLGLHQFAKMALDEHVVEIIDPQLHFNDDNKVERSRIQESLVLIFHIGVACSVESPNERMDMRDVVAELKVIRDKFLKVGIYRAR